MRYQKPRIDFTNKRFGRLRAQRDIGVAPGDYRLWECVCDCGKIVHVPSVRLKNGITRSCGCLRKETSAAQGKINTRHGLEGTGVYRSWNAMMRRCYNSECQGFKNYGGRGIGVCRWLRESPSRLLELIGDRPIGLSLNRIDNDLHYSCGKCGECEEHNLCCNIEWSTRVSQNRNSRNCVYITIDGKRKCAAEWSEITGIPVGTIIWRFKKGWTTDKLFSVGHCHV